MTDTIRIKDATKRRQCLSKVNIDAVMQENWFTGAGLLFEHDKSGEVAWNFENTQIRLINNRLLD